MSNSSLFDPLVERGYLNAIIKDNYYNEHLDDDCFSVDEYASLNRVLNSLDAELGIEEGVSLLTHKLREDGYSEDASLRIVLNVTGGEWVATHMATDYARTLRKLKQRRLLLSLADDLRKTEGDDANALRRLRQAIDDVERKTTDGKARVLSIEYLLNTQFPEPHWAIRGVLPEGLAMLAGRPKAGKSWMALQMLRDVTSGQTFMGKWETTKSKALYITLEDGEVRLQTRLREQGWKPTPYAKIMLHTDFAIIGGLDSIPRLTEVYGMILIDTFNRAMDKDQVDPKEMKQVLSPIQEAAIRNHCAVVFIDHMPKGNRSGRDNEFSVINDVFGSIAKTGVADVIWGFYRDPATMTGVLAGTSRDFVDFKESISLQDGAWMVADITARAQYGELRHTVLDAIVNAGDISQSDIVTETGLNKGSISKALDYMSQFGLLLSYRSGRRIVWQASISGKETLEKWNKKESVARQLLMAENVVK